MSAAGAVVTPTDVAQARLQMCANFQVIYASTETGIIAHLPADAPPNAALRTVSGVDVRVMASNGNLLPTGVVGRLHIRSPWSSRGYWQNPAGNNASFVADGFLSDDLGRLTSDGGLVLMGRISDTINFGGVKVSPPQVEAILLQYPELADAALVACPHVTAGEIPVAFLVFKGPPDLVALQHFMTQNLDQFSFPAAVVPCPRIDRTPDGKVNKVALRALFVRLLL
jgi:acyl-coenzyme A synthetase/AMP-(fatty) acid ligase